VPATLFPAKPPSPSRSQYAARAAYGLTRALSSGANLSTKRVRRIFTWSNQQYHEACRSNQPDFVLLTFCDYLRTATQLRSLISDAAFFGKPITHFSNGPDISNVIERRDLSVEELASVLGLH
jgi:hypothetical protein